MTPPRCSFVLSLLLGAGLVPLASRAQADWPQAAGPNHNWTVETTDPVPTTWSVATGESIRWTTPLPETGQSGIAVGAGRLFLTTMRPLTDRSLRRKGTDIVLHCFDADTGRQLWTRSLPGDPAAHSIYAYGFSNSSSPTPVTDGRHVWFWNASGRMGCWTIDGEEVWTRAWTPTLDRPFNKQYEPIKIGHTLLNVEPLPAGHPDRREDAWNYVRAFDARTGADLWTAPEGVTHYNTPVLGRLADGGHAVLYGRGAHHGVPEGPDGLTLTRVEGPRAGEAVWSWRSPPRGIAMATPMWDAQETVWLSENHEDLLVLNTADGTVAKRISLVDGVAVTSYDAEADAFTRREGVRFADEAPAVRVFPAWYANVRVGQHVLFQCFDFQGKRGRRAQPENFGPRASIARVDLASGRVEYLQLPFQPPEVEGQMLKGTEVFYPSKTVSRSGLNVAGDPRSGRMGWWWCFNGNTIAVNQHVYFTLMGGVVQVVDSSAEVFDQRALVACNDLGAFAEAWSVNTPSYSGGRLYHRTMKDLICIERPAAP